MVFKDMLIVSYIVSSNLIDKKSDYIWNLVDKKSDYSWNLVDKKIKL
jgi:hypothetical protein